MPRSRPRLAVLQCTARSAAKRPAEGAGLRKTQRPRHANERRSPAVHGLRGQRVAHAIHPLGVAHALVLQAVRNRSRHQPNCWAACARPGTLRSMSLASHCSTQVRSHTDCDSAASRTDAWARCSCASSASAWCKGLSSTWLLSSKPLNAGRTAPRPPEPGNTRGPRSRKFSDKALWFLHK